MPRKELHPICRPEHGGGFVQAPSPTNGGSEATVSGRDVAFTGMPITSILGSFGI